MTLDHLSVGGQLRFAIRATFPTISSSANTKWASSPSGSSAATTTIGCTWVEPTPTRRVTLAGKALRRRRKPTRISPSRRRRRRKLTPPTKPSWPHTRRKRLNTTRRSRPSIGIVCHIARFPVEGGSIDERFSALVSRFQGNLFPTIKFFFVLRP